MSAADPTPRPSRFDALGQHVPAFAHSDFRRYWSGSAISNTGSMMYLAALGWITADITDSAAKIALVPFIGLLPLLFVSPISGALADRVSRRSLVLVSITGQATLACVVATVVTADAITYWFLILASVIGGSFGSLGAPVMQAIVPTLVPLPALRSAVVLNSMQFNISRAVGPTAAGLLIDAIGAATVFWVNAATYLAVFWAIWSIEDRPPVRASATQRSMFGDIAAGARYAASDPPIRTALTAGGVNALLIFPISYVAPILATQSLDLDASGFGLLVGLFGAGAIVAGLFLLVDRDRSYERMALWGVFGLVIGLAIIGVAPGLGVALVGMFVTGVTFVTVSTNVLSSLQTNLDDRVRGRVMSLWMMIYGSLGPLGVIAYGTAGDIIDIQTVFLISSGLMAVYLVVMIVSRGLRPLDATREAT